MSTIVEATLPAEEFALAEALERRPAARFDVMRLVANGTGRPMPFLWAAGEDLPALRDAVAADPSTAEVDVVVELEEELLLRVEWLTHVRVLLRVLLEEAATVVDATGRDGAWHFRILFPEREGVSATYDVCETYDVGLEFERIYQLSDSLRRGQYGLSQDQYETIVRAYEAGYYHVPRTVNLQELSDRFGVSHQALSERMRRGHQTLITNTLRPELEPTVRP